MNAGGTVSQPPQGGCGSVGQAALVVKTLRVDLLRCPGAWAIFCRHPQRRQNCTQDVAGFLPCAHRGRRASASPTAPTLRPQRPNKSTDVSRRSTVDDRDSPTAARRALGQTSSAVDDRRRGGGTRESLAVDDRRLGGSD